mgnify:CR=1 FL=1
MFRLTFRFINQQLLAMKTLSQYFFKVAITLAMAHSGKHDEFKIYFKHNDNTAIFPCF